mgnify:FL=1
MPNTGVVVAEPLRIALDGRVAVVTGAARGIGRSCAETLRASGATVVCADLRFAVPSAITGAREPNPTTELAFDVQREEEVRALFEKVQDAHGRIDVLVNCAGILEAVARTVDQHIGDWDRVMSVNARGTFLCCREAGRSMLAQRSGAIVNIASVAGLVGIPGSNAYGPSKAAVAQMTRSLACEWARFGVRVNAVAPGYVDAPMAHELFRDPQTQEAALSRVPMRRLGATAEIASVVAFLCSPLAGYITGAVLPVDGGWSAFGGPR